MVEFPPTGVTPKLPCRAGPAHDRKQKVSIPAKSKLWCFCRLRLSFRAGLIIDSNAAKPKSASTEVVMKTAQQQPP